MGDSVEWRKFAVRADDFGETLERLKSRGFTTFLRVACDDFAVIAYRSNEATQCAPLDAETDAA